MSLLLVQGSGSTEDPGPVTEILGILCPIRESSLEERLQEERSSQLKMSRKTGRLASHADADSKGGSSQPYAASALDHNTRLAVASKLAHKVIAIHRLGVRLGE